MHSLEHGRIEFQYKPGTSQADIAKLQKLAEEPLNDSAGYHVLMFQNNTKMPTQFALTAWTKSLTCDKLTPQSIASCATSARRSPTRAPSSSPSQRVPSGGVHPAAVPWRRWSTSPAAIDAVVRT